MIPIVISGLGTVTKGTGGLGNKRANEDHQNYCIIKIGQNTEESPGELRRLSTLNHSISREKPPANADVKNSQNSQ